MQGVDCEAGEGDEVDCTESCEDMSLGGRHRFRVGQIRLDVTERVGVRVGVCEFVSTESGESKIGGTQVVFRRLSW
jgi:hypothetical protein